MKRHYWWIFFTAFVFVAVLLAFAYLYPLCLEAQPATLISKSVMRTEASFAMAPATAAILLSGLWGMLSIVVLQGMLKSIEKRSRKGREE